MPNATIQQKLIAALSARKEWTLNKQAVTKKYVVFAHNERPVNLYVGKKGAVRVGKTVSGSVPVNNHHITMWIDEGTEILNNSK